MSDTLQDYYNTGDVADYIVENYKPKAQTFLTTKRYMLGSIWLKLKRLAGTPTPETITCELRDTTAGSPNGAALASKAISEAVIPLTADWVEFDLSAARLILEPNHRYAICLFNTGGATHRITWRYNNVWTGYPPGQLFYSIDNGVTWTGQAYDALFETWGEPIMAGDPELRFSTVSFERIMPKKKTTAPCYC